MSIIALRILILTKCLHHFGMVLKFFGGKTDPDGMFIVACGSNSWLILLTGSTTDSGQHHLHQYGDCELALVLAIVELFNSLAANTCPHFMVAMTP